MTLKGLADDTNFSLKFNLRVKMTWGKTGVYVYEKLY